MTAKHYGNESRVIAGSQVLGLFASDGRKWMPVSHRPPAVKIRAEPRPLIIVGHDLLPDDADVSTFGGAIKKLVCDRKSESRNGILENQVETSAAQITKRIQQL